MSVAAFRSIRALSREDTTFLTRYALGIAIEVAVALWLLAIAKGAYAWAVWIAYLIFASAGLAAFIGLAWCWFWFVGRALGWFLATALIMIGACLLILGPSVGWGGIPGFGR